MQCPLCQRDNRQDAGFCDGCGSPLHARCPNCSRELRSDSRFCDGCGHAVVTSGAARPAPAPRFSPPSGFASGRYRVQRFLGEGAKKRVYLARDTRLDRPVAIGVIKTEGLDAEGRARVEREAQAMGRLGDHPNLVTVYDVVEEGDDLYIVSQYMSGGDLESRLAAANGHRLPIPDTLRLGQEICRALQHAHERGVIHRDLKPGNVWLSQQGTAHLGDFGLALSLDRTRISRAGMMAGTAAYMAPEQALGRAPDARSDLYGLGAVLYEALTGCPPFAGDDAVSVISQHLHTPPVNPSWHNAEIPKPLELLVLRLLAKDPDARPKSADEVRELLASIEAAPATPAQRTEAAEANPLDRLASGTFVGRERELEEARTCLDEGLSGRGHVLMLVGEPGIGKTRTAEELTTYARLRGAQVLWGRCCEGEGAPPYWPWVQLIRSYVHERDAAALRSEMGSGAGVIAEVVSEVRERLADAALPPRTNPDQARFRLFDGITTFLENASRGTPLVLVLDDLHWADTGSLLLLQFLVREMGESRIAVVGTYRDVELSRQHPLEEALAEISRGPHHTRVLLRGLSRRDVQQFIQRVAHVQPPDALVETVFRETEGNPFFVHEVVRLLESDGRLERLESVKSWSLEIPEGIRQVVGRRLNRLSEACNHVLSLGSVAGREFDFAVLEELAEIRGDRLLELLEEAARARVVEEVEGSPGRYRFSHALIRETLYEELSTTRRVRLHRRNGEALERLHAARVEPHLAELAYHFCESASEGHRDKAIDYAVRAAERASEQCGYEEAVEHYQRALQVLELEEPVNEVRRGELLLALGIACGDSANPDRAQEVLGRVIEVARSLGNSRLFAQAVSRLSGHRGLAATTDPEIASLTEEALNALPETDSPERATLLGGRSIQLSYQGEMLAECTALQEEARAMAVRLGDPESLAFTHLIATFAWTPAPLQKLAELDQGIAMLEAGENSTGRMSPVWLRFMRMSLLLESGNLPAYEEELAALTERAARRRHPLEVWLAKQALATRTLAAGDFEEAQRVAAQALELGLKTMAGNAWQYFSAFQFVLHWLQGRLAEIAEAARRDFGQYADVPVYSSALAFMHATVGEEPEARKIFERLAARDFRDLPRNYLLPVTFSNLIHVAVILGDRKRAALLYDMVLPFADRVFMVGINNSCLGSAGRLLGQLATVLERWPEAEQHFVSALQVNERIANRPWTARTEQTFAEMLLARNEPGDQERALTLATRALDSAQNLGMARLVEQAVATKLAAQGSDSGDLGSSIHTVSSAVRQRRPCLAPHAAPDGTVTLMFSDMEGFTAMTERLGDLQAREVIREHNAIVREQLARFDGYEVELQGDGFLVACQSARQALLCAIAIQREFEARNTTAAEKIRVRIGLHTGEALKDADKFFGKTVILAARIAGQAQGGEILVSSVVKDITESAGDLHFGTAREVVLKGISERQRVHLVKWQ